jgi:hypothetical protein
MPLCVESAVLPPDSTYSLYVTAKRYWSDTRPKPHSTPKCTGLTLVLFHATSFHKEMWEPCLEALFALVDKSKGVLIEEAWSIESPNHGESAVLNVETLRQPPFSEQCEDANTYFRPFRLTTPRTYSWRARIRDSCP